MAKNGQIWRFWGSEWVDLGSKMVDFWPFLSSFGGFWRSERVRTGLDGWANFASQNRGLLVGRARFDVPRSILGSSRAPDWPRGSKIGPKTRHIHPFSGVFGPILHIFGSILLKNCQKWPDLQKMARTCKKWPGALRVPSGTQNRLFLDPKKPSYWTVLRSFFGPKIALRS